MSTVRIFEVGARDGLQNEPKIVSLETKVRFVRELAEAGLRDIECGAFVRADKVPQMADSEAVIQALQRPAWTGKAALWALVPNAKGLERALVCGIKNIAVFTAATDGFNRANVNRSVKEHLAELKLVIAQARQAKLRVRAYVSTAFGCPFDGKVVPKKTIEVARALMEYGAHEVSIGDTIGVATPGDLAPVIKPLLRILGAKKVALHFHDTRGTALANALRSIDLGVKTLDSSAGGLGGCPFAPGATGNLATEDLVYMLDGMGVKTGVDLAKLSATSSWLADTMRRPISSRYLAAYRSRVQPKYVVS